MKIKFCELPIIFLFVISTFIVSCEEKINPALENADPVLVVDAWITNKAENQVIVLSQTQPYFDATLPAGVSGAIVVVTDNDGKLYSFVEDVNISGNYVWKPLANEVFGSVGKKYNLSIQLKGETFEASSIMGRVPPIDSITFDKDKRIGSSSDEAFYTAEFWATDAKGPGDTYWIRSYKNGVLLDKPSELNIAYDAANSAGGDADGVVFITPIRKGINPDDKDSKGNNLSPFEPGDSVKVEINSIALQAFNYLNEVATQTDRPGGFSELFAKPLANVSTNIVNVNPKGSVAVGFFNVAAVSSAGKRFKPN